MSGAGRGEVPVGRSQLRGGPGGGGVGGVHPLHRALEWAHRPLVPWNAGLAAGNRMFYLWIFTTRWSCCQVLSNVLAVVPWVIDFIVDSGWAQEIVRFHLSISIVLSTTSTLHWLVNPVLGLACELAGKHNCDWMWFRTLGKVRTSGVERGTLSAFEDFLCALVKVSTSDRNGDDRGLKANVAGKPGCEWGAKGQRSGAHLPGQSLENTDVKPRNWLPSQAWYHQPRS